MLEQITEKMSTNQQNQANDETRSSCSCEKDNEIPDLLEQLDMLSSSIVKDGEQSQASGDTAQDQGDDSLEDMLRSLHKQLKSSAVNNINMNVSSAQRLTIDEANSSALGQDIPDLLEQLDRLAPPPADKEVKQEQSQASQNSAEEQMQASGDSGTSQGPESLEDMLRSLHKQIKTSDWLQENTSEKWVKENPQLAKDYMEAMKKS